MQISSNIVNGQKEIIRF